MARYVGWLASWSTTLPCFMCWQRLQQLRCGKNIFPLFAQVWSRAVMHLRKRKRAIEAASETDPQPQPPAKRPKPSRQSRSRTPPEFWDNLSQVPLCRRALREFNRRTNRPVAPKPLVRSVLNEDLTKQLKRFAWHGGPNLRDIRGVSRMYSMENHANSFLSTRKWK